MMKALGIDFGEARIGISCSDDLGMFAHPHETIQVKNVDPIKRIVEISKEKKESRVPMNPKKSWKAKLERAYSFRVQSGKITV